MISSFRAVAYGCLKDVTLPLGGISALIGPNDSGKSSLLRGIRTVAQLASGSFSSEDAGGRTPFDPALARPARDVDATLLGCGVSGGWYAITAVSGGWEERLGISDGAAGSGEFRNATRGLNQPTSVLSSSAHGAKVGAQLEGARLLRLDPDALRQSSGLIPDVSHVGFDERGQGLPGVYQAILGRGDDAFASIRDAVRRLFPTIKRVGVTPVTSSTVELQAELQDGTIVRAAQMSEGLLYYLAFAALPYLSKASVILIEEPENGLHPARIAEVVRSLRSFAETTGTQIVMATHSPLVVNELAPEEVFVVTRPSLETGTVVTPITETKNFAKRSTVYALGELWLSYADGDREAPLINGSADEAADRG